MVQFIFNDLTAWMAATADNKFMPAPAAGKCAALVIGLVPTLNTGIKAESEAQ
jgi:hypothetical protein